MRASESIHCQCAFEIMTMTPKSECTSICKCFFANHMRCVTRLVNDSGKELIDTNFIISVFSPMAYICVYGLHISGKFTTNIGNGGAVPFVIAWTPNIKRGIKKAKIIAVPLFVDSMFRAAHILLLLVDVSGIFTMIDVIADCLCRGDRLPPEYRSRKP